MRSLVAALLSVFFLLGPAFSETVKVLILDESFTDVPDDGEKLAMLDKMNGNLVTGYSSYKGDIEVWRGKKGLYLINELPLEDYVEGVVAAESGKDWEAEALKAQAVIVRTYVLNQKLRSKGKKFDVTSSVLHQVYKGQNSDLGVSGAVDATKGEILTFDGEPIEAFYHSTCGGKTEDPKEVFYRGFPYLKPVTTSCKLSPYSSWARRIPLPEIEKAVGIKGVKEIRVKSHTVTGRAKDVVFANGSSNTTISAPDLRKVLGWKRLPSTDFDVYIDGGNAVFDGKGYGHGVGLCQWSAFEMAKAGKKYREILSHFYPGASLEIYESKGL